MSSLLHDIFAPDDLKSLALVVGMWAAVAGLGFTAFNSLAARRNTEVAAIFDLWERFERYSEALALAKTPDEMHFRAFNLFNFIENICFIYNHKRGNKNVLANIRALASDFAASNGGVAAVETVIGTYGALSSDAYSELRRFCGKERALIESKQSNLQGSPLLALAKAARDNR